MTPKFLVARGGRVRKNYDKRQRRLATDKENKRVRGANSRSVKPLYVGSIPPAPPVFSLVTHAESGSLRG
jgi:hypothetical protein